MSWTEYSFVLLLIVSGTKAQFGEIASLATSLLGGALGNGAGIGALAGAGAAGAGAAGQAGAGLAQIGQLYQLAQGALQLTGTGVGVLNQASEGNWFPAVLEQTAKNSQALMKQGRSNGLNLGALGPVTGKQTVGGIGPEFGTNFPAPNIDDYDENAEIPGVTEKKTPNAPDGLVDIEEEDYESETSNKLTTTIQTPDETASKKSTDEDESTTVTGITSPLPRQIRVQLPDKNGKIAPERVTDYDDLIEKNAQSGIKTDSTADAISDELKRNLIATHGAKIQPIVPKLDKLVEILRKSKLSQEEIDEIVAQVEGNKNIEKPAKYDFNAVVQNIPDKKNSIRQKITDASRIINSSLENQQKSQQFVAHKHVDAFSFSQDSINNNSVPITPRILETTTILASRKDTPHELVHPSDRSTTAASRSATVTSLTPALFVATENPKIYEKIGAVLSVAPHGTFTHSEQAFSQVSSQVEQQPRALQPSHPFNNFLHPHDQFQWQSKQYQPFTYNQALYNRQQPQNIWEHQQNQNNQQIGQPTYQQPHQVYHQAVQQQFGSPTPYTMQILRYPQNLQQTTLLENQQSHYPQQLPTRSPQLQSHYPLQTTNEQPISIQPLAKSAVLVQRSVHVPTALRKSIYRQGSAQPLLTPKNHLNAGLNTNNVLHYYREGKKIVQQIIPRNIASIGNFPLSGPFQSYFATKPDPVEYRKTQKILREAYYQPNEKQFFETQRESMNEQRSMRAKPQLFESTVTAVGHSQAHAIRTYQATKSADLTLINSKTSTATRNSGRVSAPKKLYTGHVLPGPTIDHRAKNRLTVTRKPQT